MHTTGAQIAYLRVGSTRGSRNERTGQWQLNALRKCESRTSLPFKIESGLERIRSTLNTRMVSANALIESIGYDSAVARKELTKSMLALRQLIDEHGRATLDLISSLEAQEKKALEDYKVPIRLRLQECQVQKAKLEIILSIRDETRLVRSRAQFECAILESDQTLQDLQVPRRAYYHIQGVDQAQGLRESIVQCARYERYSNPELEKIIVDSNGSDVLNLDGKCRNHGDMKMVVDILGQSTVSHFKGFRLLWNQFGGM